MSFSTCPHSACGPRKVISFPRTVIATEGKAASTIRRLSSCVPMSATIEMAGGTVTRVRCILGEILLLTWRPGEFTPA